jgi:hypothetical protein
MRVTRVVVTAHGAVFDHHAQCNSTPIDPGSDPGDDPTVVAQYWIRLEAQAPDRRSPPPSAKGMTVPKKLAHSHRFDAIEPEMAES